ncbi:MAG: putative Binding-protein-dependent transporter, inner rane component [Rhodospirillales bacterium]|nr:putative Binding-protein-dependent transporter, inner rane component [Rhodospirillales bacterium]
MMMRSMLWGQPVRRWQDRLRPNFWDLVAFPLLFGLLALIVVGAGGMTKPFDLGEPQTISLDPRNLPYYALRTVMRMLIALAVSFLFTLIYAAAAAKSRMAEKILIPILDILQSIPILSFLTITVTGWIALFPGSLLGPECAAIFAIFTSQAWNMTFSLYQSLRTVPLDLQEAARMYHVGPWGRFWRLELPHAMPNLVWNMMMSVSGGWFFVVAAEAFSVAGQNITLPGVGSYIATAIDQRNLLAVGYAVVMMLIVILAYDQLFFRPLLSWSNKFKPEHEPGIDAGRPWFLTMLQKAGLVRLFRIGFAAGGQIWDQTIGAAFKRGLGALGVGRGAAMDRVSSTPRWVERAYDGLLLLVAGYVVYRLGSVVEARLTFHEVLRVFYLGFLTAIRVLVLIALATAVWVPIGVWIGLRPKLTRRAQPIVQFLAAFPANLFFPIAVALILRFNANPEIWLSPLMILGTQWYILFNVIAGAASLPQDFQYVARNLGVSRWVWWRRLIIPAIFPAYITGALTAAGGSWNAAIVSEWVQWGATTLTATGIGAYIKEASNDGDNARLILGTLVLCVYVILLNRLFWRRLYDYAAERMRLDDV